MNWRTWLASSKSAKRVRLTTKPPRAWTIDAIRRHGFAETADWLDGCDSVPEGRRLVKKLVGIRSEMILRMLHAEWPCVTFTFEGRSR